MSESGITLVVIIAVLVLLFCAVYIGVRSSKRHAKTAMPGKDTEADE